MKELYEKIARVQKNIGKMKKDKEGYNYKYFDINQLLEQLLPELEKEGLVLTQPIMYLSGVNNSATILRTRIVDTNESDLQEVVSEFALPDIQDPQKMGSAITYYRRYALQSLFCLQAEDDDAASTKTKAAADDMGF